MSTESSQDGRQADRNAILEAVLSGSAEATALARWMGANPELSLEEHQTSSRYVAYLKQYGFRIEREVAGMAPAFRAEWGDPAAPVSVGLLAEMDALPEIGHACGHNLSGPASLLAARALSEVIDPADARVVVYG